MFFRRSYGGQILLHLRWEVVITTFVLPFLAPAGEIC
jgi:hypothetical protein